MNEALICLACVIGCSFPSHGYAQPDDGIYRVMKKDEEGIWATRTTGDEVKLGPKISGDFADVSIWSLSNGNDHFRVMMQNVKSIDTPGRLAIVVDGVCEMVSSHSLGQNDQGPTLLSDILGAENAAKIASALKVELLERKHPGHQLKILWRPTKDAHKIGEAVKLELVIDNVGEVPIRFMEGGQQRGDRDNQFGFTAFSQSGFGKSVPDTGNPANFGGLAAYRVLQPGDVLTKQVDISKWFEFNEPGIYQITGTYELEFRDEEFSARALWMEFATGRCNVQLEK